VHALRGVEMQVHGGEIFGLLGPNGAGKSTLVKIMMTVVRPTRAQGTLLGRSIGHKPILARVGYLPEHHRFPSHLTGRQVLHFYAALANVDARSRKRRAEELLQVVGMRDWADKKVSSYSKGMMQRVGLAQALMNDPLLVLLDEPTDGVDPMGRREIRDILIQMREQGRTVFLNSHLLSELEMVCDRVAIMVQGRVVSQGTLDELTLTRQHYVIELASAQMPHALEQVRLALPIATGDVVPVTASGAKPQADLARRVGFTGALVTGQWIEIDHQIIRVGTTEPEVVQPIIDGLRRAALVIKSMRMVRPSLEDLFLEAVTDPQTGKALAPGAGPATWKAAAS
jgi:ABC-2 type transport system ATP-binding protein